MQQLALRVVHVQGQRVGVIRQAFLVMPVDVAIDLELDRLRAGERQLAMLPDSFDQFRCRVGFGLRRQPARKTQRHGGICSVAFPVSASEP